MRIFYFRGKARDLSRAIKLAAALEFKYGPGIIPYPPLVPEDFCRN